MLKRTVLTMGILLILASLTHACLWDWDTLQMERRRFPGVLEMITGKFVRHSPAYYEWRIKDRTQRMRSPTEDPQLADDLAVAYSKLDRHAEGIALLEQTLSAHPNRYETLANLGTIHMLNGDLKTGKEYIDRAIVINPDAHFDREKYQSLLAEYFLTDRETPHPASSAFNPVHGKHIYFGFAKFVLEKRGIHAIEYRGENKKAKEELAAAQKGVLGMMHFANYDSPILLEPLGDLLIAWPSYQEDAMHLAARAYLRIADMTDDESTKREFHAAAKNMVQGNLDYIRFRGDWDGKRNGPTGDDLEKLSADLEKELAEARAFFAAIEADEKKWIAEGINVDEAFAGKYYDSLDDTIESAKKQLSRERRDVRGHPHTEAMRIGLLILAGLLAACIAIFVYVYRRFMKPVVKAKE